MTDFKIGREPASGQVANAFQTGETSEAEVLCGAVKRGYIVSKPFGHAQPYDLIFDVGKTLLRVQVKSARPVSASYVNGKIVESDEGIFSTKDYRPNDFDFYAVPFLESVWIFPFHVVHDRSSVRLNPQSRRFREAWDLIETEASRRSMWLSAGAGVVQEVDELLEEFDEPLVLPPTRPPKAKPKTSETPKVGPQTPPDIFPEELKADWHRIVEFFKRSPFVPFKRAAIELGIPEERFWQYRAVLQAVRAGKISAPALDPGLSIGPK